MTADVRRNDARPNHPPGKAVASQEVVPFGASAPARRYNSQGEYRQDINCENRRVGGGEFDIQIVLSLRAERGCVEDKPQQRYMFRVWMECQISRLHRFLGAVPCRGSFESNIAAAGLAAAGHSRAAFRRDALKAICQTAMPAWLKGWTSARGFQQAGAALPLSLLSPASGRDKSIGGDHLSPL